VIVNLHDNFVQVDIDEMLGQVKDSCFWLAKLIAA